MKVEDESECRRSVKVNAFVEAAREETRREVVNLLLTHCVGDVQSDLAAILDPKNKGY